MGRCSSGSQGRVGKRSGRSLAVAHLRNHLRPLTLSSATTPGRAAPHRSRTGSRSPHCHAGRRQPFLRSNYGGGAGNRTRVQKRFQENVYKHSPLFIYFLGAGTGTHGRGHLLLCFGCRPKEQRTTALARFLIRLHISRARVGRTHGLRRERHCMVSK